MHKYISFITGHMGFTLALEHSLQLIDPTVSARAVRRFATPRT